MPPETHDPQDPQPPAAPGWLASHRRLAMAAAVAGILAAGAIATVAVVWFTRQPQDNPITLAETLAALDAKDYVQARQLAEKMQRQASLSMEDSGGPAFVLGVVADHEAELAPQREQANSYLLAARFRWKSRRTAVSRQVASRRASRCWARVWCWRVATGRPASPFRRP